MLSQSVIELAEFFDESHFNNIVNRLMRLGVSSSTFLSSQSSFPNIFKSAQYIIEKTWFTPMMHSPATPHSPQDIRNKINFVSTVRKTFSSRVYEPFAGIMILTPALGRSDGLQMLWCLVEQLSLVSAISEMARAIHENGNGLGNELDRWRFREEVITLLQRAPPEKMPLPDELKPILENILNLFETYWFTPYSAIGDDYFIPANTIRLLDPRIICPIGGGNQTIVVQFIFGRLPSTWRGQLPRLEELAFKMQSKLEEVQSWITSRRLVFSGGFNIQVPIVEKIEPLYSEGVWLVSVKSEDPIVRARIHSGPVNIVDVSSLFMIKSFLQDVASVLNLLTNRFWLPWDSEERNLLWVGPPMVECTIPNWLYDEGVGCESVPLEVWGAQELKAWRKEAIDVDHTRPISENHWRDTMELPRGMEERWWSIPNGGETLRILCPFRYSVRILARNCCGATDRSFETGVTYPLRIKFLGAEVGQTISGGSISDDESLRHQPAWGGFMFGSSFHFPVKPPLVSYKPTYIRLFVEHNAPPPYLSPTAGYSDDPRYPPIPARLRFILKNEKDGRSLSGNAEGSVQYEGISSSIDVDTKRQRFHSMRATRIWPIVFQIPLARWVYWGTEGTFNLNGTVDIAEPVRTRNGLLNASSSFKISFTITKPESVKFYWIKVKPGQNATGSPVNTTEQYILEQWLQCIVPSILFDFRIGGIVFLDAGASDVDLLGLIDNVRGGRDGVWIAVVDEELASYCDSSIRAVGGSAFFGSRTGWAKRTENARKTAVNIAHEFCHAHPREYPHITACGDPSDASVGYLYWKPGLSSLYPGGTCGESLFFPTSDLNAEGTGAGGSLWSWPNIFNCEVKSAEESREIMTYCNELKKGFDLKKCEELLTHYDELY